MRGINTNTKVKTISLHRRTEKTERGQRVVTRTCIKLKYILFYAFLALTMVSLFLKYASATL